MGEIVFSQNVFKACDAWSVPNDRVHSWQPWVLSALSVGTGVPHGCELKEWFQAESLCLGDRHAPPGGRAAGMGWASSPPSDQGRTTLLPAPGVGRQGPFLGHLIMSSHRSLG